MTYLALARKWRPKSFDEMVGQEHVVRALSNALDSGRVHHAYLFAGTRGVGKTTVARILAKALNCEQGVSAKPCGECAACTGIDAGRFFDLIEVDAASRTKVDDTRELLENVQYTPTSGRYKVYLIDEVHMLSNHSFNALLKTLEEPPPHVKFLFATTNPQKLPVTVLSRCLQFNLKRLPSAQIVERMAHICADEGTDADPAALARLARSASGSMRDALSLLDQALAYGLDTLVDQDVADMLGSMDPRHINALLAALSSGEPAALIAEIRELDSMVPDYAAVLDDLATQLQHIAVTQFAGVESLDEDLDQATLQQFAESMDPDLVQLYYQIAVTGRRDLELAPDPRLGFEMTLLRMLAFRPGDAAAVTARPVAKTTSPQRQPVDTPQSAGSAGKQPEVPDDSDWPGVVESLAIDGAARQLAENCALESSTPFELSLSLDERNQHLLTDQLKSRLIDALRARLGAGLNVSFTMREHGGETVAARDARRAEQDLEQAKTAIETDPNVRKLVDLFGAEIDADSVRPAPPESRRD